MRYVSFVTNLGKASFGRLEGELIVELAHQDCATLREALAAGALTTLPSGASFRLDEVELLPVIPDPGKILCVGLNYATHVKETGREQKEHPAIFTRWTDSLAAHGQALLRPRESIRFDYEGELAVVIGKAGRRISPDAAIDHVAGYSIFQDASVRDWQRHNIQFTPGKNFPATGGFGPVLVTPDEIPEIHKERVVTRLNGQVVQDQAISDMIWDIPAIIAYCSTFTPLAPGDVIATGTPGGVGDKREPPIYMKEGDVVEVEIDTIGTLVNPIVDEK